VQINWTALGEVLVVGLLIGVGVVALFAFGARGLSDHADARRSGRASVAGMATAVVSFALCVAVVGFGIYVIVSK
jgi:NAD/NADP transhydrogenase beta subunit